MHVVNGALGPDQSPAVPLQEVSTAVSSLSRTVAGAETIEGDRELYERAVQRVRTSGKTVRIEDVLGEPDSRPSEAD